ncbi:MAG: CvfD/Ygs/GSP13 family RNA-binding post-transcriptional regulator [Erysipelotrichaceae bacterium]
MEYVIGEEIEGVITGLQPYGAFVYLDAENRGLIHISEISDGFIKDITSFFTVGEKVKVKIIDEDHETHQFKLSIKAIDGKGRKTKNRHNKYVKVPVMKIGFNSLKVVLEDWIKEANS